MRLLAFLSGWKLSDKVVNALSADRFVVEAVTSAEDCLRSNRCGHHEGILVGSESLAIGGLSALARLLREDNPGAAIFVFADYFDLEQRLHLFETGVDYCIHEPFCGPEMVARLRLAIRLHQAASAVAAANQIRVLRAGDLELDIVRQQAVRSGRRIDLRPKEAALLECLIRNVNRPVTRTMILEQVWNSSFEGLTNVVDVYISALRNKVDRGFPQKMIRTDRGIGYTLTCASAVQRDQ